MDLMTDNQEIRNVTVQMPGMPESELVTYMQHRIAELTHENMALRMELAAHSAYARGCDQEADELWRKAREMREWKPTQIGS